jgi:hypothetical protein
MNVQNAVIWAVVAGIVIALLTGAVNTTPTGLVGAAWFGWPVAWMYNLVTHPPATNLNFLNLVPDVVVWSAIAFAVLYLIGMAGTRKR